MEPFNQILENWVFISFYKFCYQGDIQDTDGGCKLSSDRKSYSCMEKGLSTVWFGSRVVRVLDLQSTNQQVWIQILAIALLTATLGELFTYVPLPPSSIAGTSQWTVMLVSWGGNRTAGLAVSSDSLPLGFWLQSPAG